MTKPPPPPPGVLKHGLGYDLIVVEDRSRLVLGIRCQTCRRISFHPTDVQQRYCGACRVFHEEAPPPGRMT
jgi:hypothetical protein